MYSLIIRLLYLAYNKKKPTKKSTHTTLQKVIIVKYFRHNTHEKTKAAENVFRCIVDIRWYPEPWGLNSGQRNAIDGPHINGLKIKKYRLHYRR